MGTTLVLDALKKHNLEEYYTRISSHGISQINNLAELTIHDCPKFGIHSSEEKGRFLALTQDLRERIRNSNANHLETIATKKRMIGTNKLDQRTRRMTLAPQNIIPKTAPPKTSVKDRRMSYLPRRESMYQRPVVAIPKQAKSIARPKFLDELNVEKKRVALEKPNRLLDTYGIPITQKQQRLSINGNHNGNNTSDYKSRTDNQPQQQQQQQSIQQDLPLSDLHQRIRVCVRKRPLSKKELVAKEKDIAVVSGHRTVNINAPRTKIDLTRVTEQHPFTFDEVFDSNITNQQIYKRTAKPLVDYMFKGGKATCFAHGQTGSGKTYTMLDPNHGLYFLAAKDVFRLLSSHRHSHLTAYVAFYEIYQNQIYDLLNNRTKLSARVDANNDVVIAGLKYYKVKAVHDLMKIFDDGNQERVTGQTGANSNSSRSHAILQIILKDGQNADYGKLSFIDLAGSERGADRGDSSAKTRMEGAEINKSLLALKECIRALDQEQKHTPFRGSKLTQVLRDSFIGDSRTCMIATISPNISNSEHTLNTLRYADRMKQLRGESDPRLASDGGVEEKTTSNLDEFDDSSIMSDNTNEDRNNMSSLEHMLNDESENILDISYPEMMSNVLTTPTSNRVWDEKTTELRLRNQISRLESPPSEVFEKNEFVPNMFERFQQFDQTSSSNLITPDFSVPMEEDEPLPSSRHAKQEKQQIVGQSNEVHLPEKRKAIEETNDENDNDHDHDHGDKTKTKTKNDSNTPALKRHRSNMSIDNIRQFIKYHRAQIKELDEILRSERKLVTHLSLTVSGNNDFRNENEKDDEDEESKELFEKYLNDAYELSERKMSCVEIMQEKIKNELHIK